MSPLCRTRTAHCNVPGPAHRQRLRRRLTSPARVTSRLAGAPGPFCQPGGQYFPDFRAERFKLPYSYAPFRPVMNDVRGALASQTAAPVVSVPVFGYGTDIAITYSYQGKPGPARRRRCPCSPRRSARLLLTARLRLPP
jgi:hypothetical protein